MQDNDNFSAIAKVGDVKLKWNVVYDVSRVFVSYSDSDEIKQLLDFSSLSGYLSKRQIIITVLLVNVLFVSFSNFSWFF